MTDYVVFADYVVRDGERFERCVRAVGLARCGGAVQHVGSRECDDHRHGRV